MTAPIDPSKTANELIQLLEDRGNDDYIGESISQLEHCLQCAHCGIQAGSDEETIIAALLHDIGQFLPVDTVNELKMNVEGGSVGRVGHEIIGEEYLKRLGFRERVWRLVGSHVAAKRYLTAVDSTYYNGLSEASKQSLKFQGGPFQGKELEDFQCDPMKDEMVELRKWDDQAKVIGMESSTPRAESYKGMITKHLQTSQVR